MSELWTKPVVVAGASGFIGSALVPALLASGHAVRALYHRRVPGKQQPRLEWVQADLLEPHTLERDLAGGGAAYYLVHSLEHPDFAQRDRRAARNFGSAAARAGLERIIYLGGVAPTLAPSAHLASRLEVGQLLRGGRVPALELRASMIIGRGSASWRIVRDLSLRLPAMVLPAWLSSRSCPIALDDTVQALVDALNVPLPVSAWYDIPGPDTLSGEEMLRRVAAIRGRRLVYVRLPLLSPRLSSVWIGLVTGAPLVVARELVEGLRGDLLPKDRRYYELTGHPPRLSFDEAVRLALASEAPPRGVKGRLGQLEEALVDALPRGRRLTATTPRG